MNQTLNNGYSDIKEKLLFFLLWPFGAFLYSILSIKKKSSIVIIYLWFLVFGIGFSADNSAVDSSRYVNEFENYGVAEQNSYASNIHDYFTFNTKAKDIYTLTVFHVFSYFTHNYHWVYFFFAAVFAFFYVASLSHFLDLPRGRNLIIYFSLLLLFCISNPIFNINGVRFWTAAWIGVYLLFKVFVDLEKKYIPFIFLLPLIHGSFFIYIIVFGIVLLTKRFKYFWIYLFVLSLFLSNLPYLDVINHFKDSLPVFMQNLIWSYTETQEALDKINGTGVNALPLYAQILDFLPQLLTLVIVVIFIFNQTIFKSQSSKNVFVLILIWMTFVNITKSVPAVGYRYSMLILPFISYLWLKHSEDLIKYRYVIYLIPFAYSYQILYLIRNIISISDLSTYCSPLPYIIYINLL